MDLQERCLWKEWEEEARELGSPCYEECLLCDGYDFNCVAYIPKWREK